MGEFYNQLVVKVASNHELFYDFLSDTLPMGFEETDKGFVIRSEDNLDVIAWGIEQFKEALQKALHSTIILDMIPSKEKNEDWIKKYQDSITPITINQFYIHPSWVMPKEGAINIAIDPALSFGTGHHPTTASCVTAIAKYIKPSNLMLDVGCGSGILGICALKLGAKVDSCDTDKVSVENTHKNAVLNNVTHDNIWHGSVSSAARHYDVVVANIVADVLELIAGDLISSVKTDGILIISGILNKYKQQVLQAYSACKIVEIIEQDEWITIILQKDS